MLADDAQDGSSQHPGWVPRAREPPSQAYSPLPIGLAVPPPQSYSRPPVGSYIRISYKSESPYPEFYTTLAIVKSVGSDGVDAQELISDSYERDGLPPITKCFFEKEGKDPNEHDWFRVSFDSEAQRLVELFEDLAKHAWRQKKKIFAKTISDGKKVKMHAAYDAKDTLRPDFKYGDQQPLTSRRAIMEKLTGLNTTHTFACSSCVNAGRDGQRIGSKRASCNHPDCEENHVAREPWLVADRSKRQRVDGYGIVTLDEVNHEKAKVEEARKSVEKVTAEVDGLFKQCQTLFATSAPISTDQELELYASKVKRAHETYSDTKKEKDKLEKALERTNEYADLLETALSAQEKKAEKERELEAVRKEEQENKQRLADFRRNH